MCILLQLKKKLSKKWSTDSCYDTYKPWKSYAKWNKSDTKGYILHNSICEMSWTGKFIEAESRLVVVRVGGTAEDGGIGCYGLRHEVSF